MSKMFRLLKADEIECRVQKITEDGLVLLLYKNARCDMNILDETVGAMNWKREHTRNNSNCIVSIFDEVKKEWVSKEDTGTESVAEAAKGLASDSFKRCCVNWGIGRELYTSPFIWIRASDTKIEQNNGKFYVKDTFDVKEIKYTADEKISYLEITGKVRNGIVFRYGAKIVDNPVVVDVTSNRISALNAFAERHGMSNNDMKNFRNNLITVNAIPNISPLDLTDDDFNRLLIVMEENV